jgi:hypothetical protein
MQGNLSISPEKEDRITSHLFTNWQQEKDKKNLILYIPREEIKTFPNVYPFGVLGVDWPGILEIVASVVHNMDWNLCYIRGFTLRHDTKKLFIFLVGVEISSAEMLQKFNRNKENIKRTLKLIAESKMRAKQRVLLKELRKLPKLEETLQCLRKQTGGKIEETLEEEALKFFAGRTEEYLDKRDPTHLARQILTNYIIKKKVRDSGGMPQVSVDTFETKDGSFTGISFAGFLRDLSLTDCLETIEDTFPGSTIVYSHEFITYDGIANYRVELKGEKNRVKLKRAVRDVIRGRKTKRSLFLEKIGGIEQYARVIIPYLLKEVSLSGMPQVFIAPLMPTKEAVSFKLIIVHKKGEIRKIVQGLHNRYNFYVKTVQPTRYVGNTKLDIINIEVPREIFESKQEVYPMIKSVIKETIGNFRDFDEGMRTQSMKKLREVERITKSSIPKHFLRHIYCSLEDFYRASASPEEVVSLVRMGYSLYKRCLKHPGMLHAATRALLSNHGFVLIGVSTTRDILADIVELMSSYKSTSSSVSIGNTYLHFFRLEKDGGTIPKSEVRKLIYTIRRLQ